MPIYEYRCDNGHVFEVTQRMTEDPVTTCSTCEAPVQRVFHPVAVHFKGKGFYNTDYGTRRRNREQESSKESSSSSDGAGKSDAKPAKEKVSSDTKPKSDAGASKATPKKADSA